MKKALIKDTFREIKKSFGRFISIFGIVLVGVAFFTGVKSSARYMKYSADTYFDNNNLFDLKMYSNVGFDDADIEELGKTDGIDRIEGVTSIDVITNVHDNDETVQIFSYDFSSDDNLNKITLTEGRFPKNPGECVIRDYGITREPIELGTELAIKDDNLKSTSYKVVGKVSTPYYLSYQYDTTTVGSGKISDVLFISEDEFTGDRYTVLFATVKGAKEKYCYGDTYFDIVTPVKEKIIENADDLSEKYAMLGGYTFYALDRNSHYSFVDYKNCGDRMDAIAKVFPAFFYLVAALVCLTTMTRMVDEQRGGIGTLKALGYNKISIAGKYITYALLASLAGGVLGCVLGLLTFPRIIFNAWNIVYTVADFTEVPQISMCVLAIMIAVLINVLATFASCFSMLTETPALLLRPKSPKNGKKVFLEHIPFIWKHFNFTKKVTARNILRYKKRFFMTITGIAGCTALILAGFGIKNSISKVTSDQYGTIFAYDIAGEFSEASDKDSFYNEYKENKNIKDIYIMTSHMGTAKKSESEDTTKNVTIVSVDDGKRYSGFTGLTYHTSKETAVIPEDGALVTYKLAKDFNLKENDNVSVTIDDRTYEFKIRGIVDMYVGQYVFVNDRYYKEVTGSEPDKNYFIANLNIEGDKEQQAFGSEMIEKYGIKSISYYNSISSDFNDTISSLSIITVILIISAGLLAFVVLYNLINVNLSERIREIATIKVLGFYDKEVANYVYRENIILSIIGAIIGLGLGKILHSYIMTVIEMDDVVFPKMIFWYSYIISFAITIVFGIIVNLTMYNKLKKIPMVESLKSVE